MSPAPEHDLPLRSQGFAPVVDANTRVLVLGSLPGVPSLKAAQYYGNPRNAFWKIIGELIGQPLAGMGYEDRLTVIKAHGIGLWDVIASAERRGSLDTAIRAEETADLEGLIKTLPALKVIGFNGSTAAKLGRRLLEGRVGTVRLVNLPSSSPAYASRSYAQKLEDWRPLLDLS